MANCQRQGLEHPRVQPRPLGLALAISALVAGAAGAQVDLQTWCAPGPTKFFGSGLDFVGDVDRDGFAEIIVGSSSGPLYQAYVLSAKDGHIVHSFPGFGYAVAGLGDQDADGIPDFALSAFPFGGAFPNGCVEVRSGLDGSVLLHVEGTEPGGNFGGPIGGAGDVDGDGVGDILVGAPATQVGPLESAGRVLVYSGANGSLLYERLGSAEDGSTGSSVAGLGDLDGDGRADFAFSDAQPSGGGLNLKQVRVVSGATGATIHLFSSSAPSVFYPPKVDAAGDIDADGVSDILVGFACYGPGDDPAAIVFSGATGAELLQAPGGWWRVHGLDDLNADGVPDFGVWEPPGFPVPTFSRLNIRSGVDGTSLFHLDGEDNFGQDFASVGDLDGDGRPDVTVADPIVPVTQTTSGCITAISMAPPTIASLTPTSVQVGYVGSLIAQLTGTGFARVGQVKVGPTVLAVGTSAVTITSPTSLSFVVPPTGAFGEVPVTVSNTGAVPSNAVSFGYLETHPPALAAPFLAFTQHVFAWDIHGGANDTAVLLLSADGDTITVKGWPLLQNFLVLTAIPLDTIGHGGLQVTIPASAYGLFFYSQVATLDAWLVGTSNVTTSWVFN